MPLKTLPKKPTLDVLVKIVEIELAGAVLYTHYALMTTGPYRISIVPFFKSQAQESLLHAQQAGELLTGLGGHPSLQIAKIRETHDHSISTLLKESLEHESRAIETYDKLRRLVEGKSVHLEEFARQMMGQEELHLIELQKMLRDFG